MNALYQLKKYPTYLHIEIIYLYISIIQKVKQSFVKEKPFITNILILVRYI
jgi:hypothetical protein